MRWIMVVCLILIAGSLSAASYDKYYDDAVVICQTKLSEEGDSCVLDLPFPITSQDVVCEGRQFYGYPIPKDYEGKEVMAYVTFEKKYAKKAKEIELKDPLKDPKYKTHYKVIKSDVYGVWDDGGFLIKPYEGIDKDEIMTFDANLKGR